MPNSQIQVPLSGGPNETVDPRQLAPGTVTTVRNAVYDLDGSYQPRLGYVALTGHVSDPSGVRALYTLKNELLATDGLDVYSFDSTRQNWYGKDAIPDLLVTSTPLQAASQSFQSWASAVYQNYRVVAWVDNVDFLCRVAVFDIDTGMTQGPTALPQTFSGPTGVANVSVGIVGTTAIIIVSQAGGASIQAATVALSPLGVPSAYAQLDAGDVYGSFIYGAAFLASTFVIAYEEPAVGGLTVKLRSFNAALALQTTSTKTLTAGTHPLTAIALDASIGSNLWIAFAASATGYATGALVMRADPATLAVSAGPFAVTLAASIAHSPGFLRTINCSVRAISSTDCLAAFSLGQGGTGGLNLAAVAWQQFNVSGASSQANGATNCWLVAGLHFDAFVGECAALLFVPNSMATWPGRKMVSSSPASFPQVVTVPGSYALVGLPTDPSNASSVDYWGTLDPQIVTFPVAGGPQNLALPLAQASPLSSLAWEWLAPAVLSQGRLGLNVLTVSRAATAQRVGTVLGSEFYLGGGYYDGDGLIETGFVHSPLPFTAADQSGSPTNSFEYVCTWAWVDRQGNLEESGPSVSVFEVSSATPNVLLTVSAMHLTRKQREPGDTTLPGDKSSIFLLIYRTQALEHGDNTLHLVTAIPYPSGNENSLLTDQIVVTDTLPDATLATQAVLYTVSGELAHDAPPMLHALCTHNNRVWGLDPSGRIWYSQTFVAGVAPAWSLLASFTVDDANEAPTALADLYDKLLVFTRRRTYVCYGDGGSIAGTGADLTPPQRVPSITGCVDPRSIVSTPLGVMFQSERGIELVTPALGVEFVGQPVSVTTGLYPVCSAAALDDEMSTVRFCLSTSDTFASQAGGLLLVYDVRRQRWTMHYLTAGGAAGNVAGAPSYACTFHPLYGFVEGHNLDEYGHANTAVIGREAVVGVDASPWLDYAAYFVPLSVTLAWIKSGDLQGWQTVRRIRVLADVHDQAILEVGIAYDYVPTLVDNMAFPLPSVVENPAPAVGPLQVMVRPTYGRCEALRLTLSTAPNGTNVGSTGRGLGFIGAAFEILPKKGGYRRFAPAQRG